MMRLEEGSRVEDGGVEGPRDQGVEGPRDQGVEGPRDQGAKGSRGRGSKGSRDQGSRGEEKKSRANSPKPKLFFAFVKGLRRDKTAWQGRQAAKKNDSKKS